MSDLDVRDQVLELARLYETVAALETRRDPMRTVPGPRIPPGAQEVLDEDELTRALGAVDDDARSWAHIVMDTTGDPVPDLTPARLRYVAAHVAVLLDDDDELLTLAFLDDLDERTRGLRHLAHRGVRVVRTGHQCADCDGHYVSPLGSPDDHGDASLVCTHDPRHRVAYAVWSSWPRERVQWVTAEHAMRMAGLPSVAAVWQQARRKGWRRTGTGRSVRYYVPDVRGDTREDVPRRA